MTRKYDAKSPENFIKAFIYLDISNPFVCWNICHGIICSPGSVQDLLGDPQIYSVFFRNKLINKKNLDFELSMEAIRAKEFSNKNPRLNSLYFFETKKEALMAENLISSFKREYLKEVLVYNKSISKYDMNWITYKEKDSVKNDINWIRKYWNGEVCPISKYGIPIWECLTNQPLIIPDTEFVRNVRDKICGDSELLKCLAIWSNYSGTHMGGLIGAVFYSIIENHSGHLGHQVIAPFCYCPESGLIEMAEHMKQNGLRFPLPSNFDKNNPNASFFKVPDMRTDVFCLNCGKYVFS